MRMVLLLVSALAMAADATDPTVLTDSEQNSILRLRNREITANATMIDLQRQFEKAQREFQESEAAEKQLTQLLGKTHNCEGCQIDGDLKWVKPELAGKASPAVR